MTITYKLERKQVVVIIGSGLLAISSYFIPLPDRAIPRSPQVEQAQEPLLSTVPATEQQPVSVPIPGQATSTLSAEETPTPAVPLPPYQPTPVDQPLTTNRPTSAQPPAQANQASPRGEPLSTRDFYTTSPDSNELQVLPITQSNHF